MNGPVASLSGRQVPALLRDAAGQQVQDVFVMPTDGRPHADPDRVHSPFADGEPQFSPDGRWLAYSLERNRTKRGLRTTVPDDRGEMANLEQLAAGSRLWRSDGKELFFVGDDRKFYAVDVSSSGRLRLRCAAFSVRHARRRVQRRGRATLPAATASASW